MKGATSSYDGYLLDTNFISEVVCPHPETRVMGWLGDVDEALLFLSVLTLGEIRKGVASLAQSRRRTLLETWLNKELKARFSGRILTVDSAIADRWGLLAATAKKNGRKLSTIDGLLAATAIQLNLTIVSRNENDFGGMQVQILNPWKA